VEWAPYAAAFRSIERRQHLEDLLAAGSGAETVVAACLRPPLYAIRFREGFGTLHTAEYRPAEGRARYHWPGVIWEHSLDKVGQDSVRIDLGTAYTAARGCRRGTRVPLRAG
jgi:hypothetical protein